MENQNSKSKPESVEQPSGKGLSSSALLGVVEFTTRALVADDGQIQLWCSRGKNGEQSEDIGLAYDGIDGEPRIAEVDVRIRIDLDDVFAGRTVEAEILSPNANVEAPPGSGHTQQKGESR